jgi:quercetin dioxygenase-like cupin family protein
MEPKFNAATPQRPTGERPLDAPWLVADLPTPITQLRQENTWQEGDRNAITLFKTAGLTIVLLQLRAGATLSVGISEGLLSLHLLKGRLQLEADSAEPLPALNPGQLLALHAGVPYRVTALTDEATLLLTLAGHPRPPEAGGPPYLLRLADDVDDIRTLLEKRD